MSRSLKHASTLTAVFRRNCRSDQASEASDLHGWRARAPDRAGACD